MFGLLCAFSLTMVAVPASTTAPLPMQESSIIKPGDPVRVIVENEGIHIEREAIAVQAARAGQMLFVKTRDGAVFSVRAVTAQ